MGNDLDFVGVPDWFETVEEISLQDPRLKGKERLSTFQVMYSATLPLFFRIAEAPTFTYINLKKFLEIAGRVVTSPPDPANNRIKSIQVNPAGDGLVVEFLP